MYQTPKPINTGGRWCVQIGAFHNESDAIELKAQLLRALSGRERDRVSRREQLLGADSSGGRRPRRWPEYIARHVQPVEGEAFLTRLD